MTLYSTIVCNENKIPNTTPEESKHVVMDDIKIVPKSSSTEEKKSDEIEQTNQSSESTDKDEEKEQNSQSSETTKKREPIPIYYNDKIVRYLLPGEDAPDNTEPVFDEFNNIEKYILSHTCSEPIPVKMYDNIVRYILPGEDQPSSSKIRSNREKIEYYYNDDDNYICIYNKYKTVRIPLRNIQIWYNAIPIYYNDKIVRYVLPGEDAPDYTEPVFDEYDKVSRFIISDDSIKDVSKQTKTKYIKHKLYTDL